MPAGKWEISFLQCSLTGFISHIPGLAQCSEAVGQHKLGGVFWIFLFHFVLFWHAFCLIGLFPVLIFIFVVFWYFFFAWQGGSSSCL